MPALRNAIGVALALFQGGVAATSTCHQDADCILNCADLTDQCATLFCPGCEKAGYCDTTCGFCSASATPTPPPGGRRPPTSTAPARPVLPQGTCESVNARSDQWCAAANKRCDACNSDSLCAALFCPTCKRAHECDETCGYCSIPTTTSSTSTASTTTTTSVTTTSGTATTSTTTTASATATSSATGTSTATRLAAGQNSQNPTAQGLCYDSDGETKGRGCSEYTAATCAAGADTLSFAASTLCCVCGGGRRSCMNLDFSATDSLGRGCGEYTRSTCQEQKDDGDFTAATMCCVCGGGSERTSVSSGSQSSGGAQPVLVQALPREDEGDDAAGAPLLLLLLLAIVPLILLCGLCCCGFRRYRMRKRGVAEKSAAGDAEAAAAAVPTEAPSQATSRCFVLEERGMSGQTTMQGQSTSQSRTMQGQSTTQSRTRTMAHTTTAASTQADRVVATACGSPSHVVAVDDSQEASVYETTCDLFDKANWQCGAKSSSDMVLDERSDFGTVSGALSAAALDGAWVVHGRPDMLATIDGRDVSIRSAQGSKQMALHHLPNGGFALTGDGPAVHGHIVGSSLLWDNGESWRRAPLSGHVTPSAGSFATSQRTAAGNVAGRGQTIRFSPSMTVSRSNAIDSNDIFLQDASPRAPSQGLYAGRGP